MTMRLNQMPNSLIPPDELIQQWILQAPAYQNNGPNALEKFIATCAAQYGADVELDECCDWLINSKSSYPATVTSLRFYRRSSPINLKKQAIAILDRIQGSKQTWELEELEVVRRALDLVSSD